jgi:uncharacterized oxidoreductase
MLKGKTILITGGGSGIGAAFATLLCRENRIIICGRTEDRLSKIAAENKNISYYVADISVPGDIDELFKQLRAEGIILDTMFNNAGVVEQWDVYKTQLSSAQIFEKFNTNLSGAVALTQQFINQSNRSNNNLIVNITSAVAVFPFPILGLYSAAKSGLSVFTKVLRQQLKGSKFQVVEILPSQVETDMPERSGFTSKGIDVNEFVAKSIKAINRRKAEYSPDGNFMIVKLLNRLLPKSTLLNLADRISKRILKTQ